MRKPNSIQVEDFLLIITSQNTLFTLEAEHEPTGKLFTINLDSDSIGQVTNGLFESVDKMIQGLKEAADSNFENIRLDIDLEGKLTYTAVFTSEVVNKEFGFTLNLTEKKMDPIQIFSRKLDSFKSDMEEWKEAQETKVQALVTKMESGQAYQARNEERFDKLEKMMIQMEQRMTQRLEKLEKLCENLKAPVTFKPEIEFNKASENILHFALDDEGKTLKSIREPGSFLEILPQIPSSGQYSYSLRINNVMKSMGYGIIKKTENIDWNDGNNRYEFWTMTGNIFGRAFVAGEEKGPFVSQGSVLKMVVDMDLGTLTFFINGKEANCCEISKSDNYLAFIDLAFGDSITFL